MKFLLVFFIFCTIKTYSTAQEYKTATNKTEIKTTIEKKHQDTKSITADFSEKIQSDMFKDNQVEYGKFYYKKEDKIRWEHNNSKQLILIDGNQVKLYEDNKLVNNPSSQKMVKQIQNMMFSMLSGNFLNEKEYNISYYENAKNYKLILVPKNNKTAKYISKIELIFNKNTALLNEMILIEKEHQKIIYTFTNIKSNVSIDNSKFNTK